MFRDVAGSITMLGVVVALSFGSHALYLRYFAPTVVRALPDEAEGVSSWTQWEEPLLTFDDGADERVVAAMPAQSFYEYARRLDLECEPIGAGITCSRVSAGSRYVLPDDLLDGEAPRRCGMDCEARFVVARWEDGRVRARQFHTAIWY